jgi:tetratricopeptide (TPR) repeat protein
MHLLLLLASIGLSPAFAAPVKPFGTPVAQGVVEVPLYAGLDGSDPFSYVEATVGEQKLLLRVATGHRKLLLSDAAVGRLGLKASGGEGSKTTSVANLALGGVTFAKAKASIEPVNPSGTLPVDGEIGLPGAAGLAFAVVPSAGVLRMATGTGGEGLVAGIGGTPGSYGEATKDRKVRVGAGEKATLYASPINVDVAWSGVAVRAMLALEAPASWLSRELDGGETWYTVRNGENTPVSLPAAPVVARGETRAEWREVSVGGASQWASVDRPGQGPVWVFALDAKVGVDVLGTMDFAVDPTKHRFAAKAAPTVKKADYGPTYEATLRKALEVAPLKEGAPEPTAEEKAKTRAGALAPLADFLETRGRMDDAVAARREIAAADPDVCTGWTSLGSTLIAAGHPADAVEPLTKASALYQPWAALSLEERADLGEAKAKSDKKKETWTGQVPQDHACHVAPGLLALAQLQAGNAAAVASIYPAQLDLDPNLPLAAGTADLLQGKFDDARAAYLQALKLTGEADEGARVGLYLALAPHDFPAARLELERLRLAYAGNTDPLLVRLYVEGIRKVQGADGVRSALTALLAASPADPVLLTQMGKELATAGDTAGAEKAFAAARSGLDERLRSLPADPALLAAHAGLLVATGQTAQAQAAAESAVKLAPDNGMAWLALSDAAAAAGDSAKAAESRKHAGMAWALNPAYALLLAQ